MSDLIPFIDTLTPSAGQDIQVEDRDIDRVLPRQFLHTQVQRGRGPQARRQLQARTKERATDVAQAAARLNAARRIRESGRELRPPERAAEIQSRTTLARAAADIGPRRDPLVTQEMFDRFLLLKGGGDKARGFGVFMTEVNQVSERLAIDLMNARTARARVNVEAFNAETARRNANTMAKELIVPAERILRTIFTDETFEEMSPLQRLAAFEMMFSLMLGAGAQEDGSLLDQEAAKARDDLQARLTSEGYFTHIQEAFAKKHVNENAMRQAAEALNRVAGDPAMQRAFQLFILSAGGDLLEGVDPANQWMTQAFSSIGGHLTSGRQRRRFRRATQDILEGTTVSPVLTSEEGQALDRALSD